MSVFKEVIFLRDYDKKRYFARLRDFLSARSSSNLGLLDILGTLSDMGKKTKGSMSNIAPDGPIKKKWQTSNGIFLYFCHFSHKLVRI